MKERNLLSSPVIDVIRRIWSCAVDVSVAIAGKMSHVMHVLKARSQAKKSHQDVIADLISWLPDASCPRSALFLSSICVVLTLSL